MLTVPTFPLQIFYDGSCSVCATEMELYRRQNPAGRLEFIDISAPGFDPPAVGIPLDDLMAQLHAIDAVGRVYRGVDAFWAIWNAFRPASLYGLLATVVMLPGMNAVARLGYAGFARIRKYLPRRHDHCEGGTCRIDRW